MSDHAGFWPGHGIRSLYPGLSNDTSITDTFPQWVWVMHMKSSLVPLHFPLIALKVSPLNPSIALVVVDTEYLSPALVVLA